MSTAMPTPGPWFFNGTHVRRSYARPGEGSYSLADVHSDVVTYVPESLANGRCMAASREMLELLLQVQDGMYDADAIAHMNWLARVNAVIAKVEGITR